MENDDALIPCIRALYPKSLGTAMTIPVGAKQKPKQTS
jgi:hypothetical protein